MDLPDLVRRQAQAEGWHLRSLAALDHGLQEALVAELGGEEVRPPRAGAVVADVALAGVGDPAGGDGVRLAKERICQFVISPGRGSSSAAPSPPPTIGREQSRGPQKRACKDQGFAAGSIFSITCALYMPPSSTLPSIANTHSIPPFGAE